MNEDHMERIASALERIADALEARETKRYRCPHPGCTSAKSSIWQTCAEHRPSN